MPERSQERASGKNPPRPKGTTVAENSRKAAGLNIKNGLNVPTELAPRPRYLELRRLFRGGLPGPIKPGAAAGYGPPPLAEIVKYLSELPRPEETEGSDANPAFAPDGAKGAESGTVTASGT